MDSNLLSSICLGGAGARPKYPGCVNLFLHLFDWNRGLSASKRGLLPAGPDSGRIQEARSSSTRNLKKNKQQQQQQQNKKKNKKQQRKQVIVDQEERPQLPMAKLLLIADEKRRGSSRSFSSMNKDALSGRVELEEEEQVAKAGEVHSLQELLHLDSEPAMLQELMLPSNANNQDEVSPAEQLFSLLLQEAKVTPAIASGSDDDGRRNSKRWTTKRRRRPATGCAGSLARGFFLDAAAKILEPSSSQTKGRKRIGFEYEDEEGTTGASTCSIPSLMELFSGSDDLSDCSRSLLDSSSTRMTTYTATTTVTRMSSMRAEVEPVPVHDLSSQEYVSFRDFLTRSCSSSSSRSSLSSASSSKVSTTNFTDPKEMNADECKLDGDMTSFMVLHNPLFEAEDEDEDCSSLSRHHQPSSATDSLSLAETLLDVLGSEQEDGEDDDESLEDMLKSILSDASKQRITWSPHESDVFNNGKECSSVSSSSSSHECKSVDEATSESNCSEDCQPSPVSVLDASLFDDDIPRKGGKQQQYRRSSSRKKLEFGEPSTSLLDTPASPPSLTTTTCEDSTVPAAISHYEDAETLEEAFDYVTMVLRDSGLPLHKEAMLLLLFRDSGRLLDDQLFERLEDRMRVEQLIQHLEAYNGGERQPLNLRSLRSQYQCYNDYRAQRRVVFDFVVETLDNVLDELAMDNHNDKKPCLRSMSGMDVAVEVESRVRRWRRLRLESAEVDDEIVTKLDRYHQQSSKAEASATVAECERQILGDLLDELVNELLPQVRC